jgi:hypothetical protein
LEEKLDVTAQLYQKKSVQGVSLKKLDVSATSTTIVSNELSAAKRVFVQVWDVGRSCANVV